MGNYGKSMSIFVHFSGSPRNSGFPSLDVLSYPFNLRVHLGIYNLRTSFHRLVT